MGHRAFLVARVMFMDASLPCNSLMYNLLKLEMVCVVLYPVRMVSVFFRKIHAPKARVAQIAFMTI